MLYNAKIVKYFWEHVAVCDHGLSCHDCCWLWTGTCNPQGYGVLTVYDKEQYARTKCGVRTFKAPRLALELAAWAFLPTDIWALHACNNPPCCNHNTGHVYPGTPQDNARDTIRAGRHISQAGREIPFVLQSIRRGADHWMHLDPVKARQQIEHRVSNKLTPQDAITIVQLSQAGLPVEALRQIFPVTRQHIEMIVTGKRWRLYTKPLLH